MKTCNVYFATLSMVITKNRLKCTNKKVSNDSILVQKKGHYPLDVYYDMKTGLSYRPYQEDMPVGTYFIDGIAEFSYMTGSSATELPKRKIIRMYDRTVAKR